MTIESLIEELEQIIDEGKSVPFTSNQIVDVERLRTTIEDMRLNMPDELMQARKIASERKEILTAAQSTAEGIITAAKKKADELISEHEITKGAEAEAENIMAEARKKANGIVEQARGTAAELTEQAQKWSNDMRKSAGEYVERVVSMASQLTVCPVTHRLPPLSLPAFMSSAHISLRRKGNATNPLPTRLSATSAGITKQNRAHTTVSCCCTPPGIIPEGAKSTCR